MADRIGEGSRAICFSQKRSLEYWGPARRCRSYGRQGRGLERRQRFFHGAEQLYQFNLPAGAGPQDAGPSSTCSSFYAEALSGRARGRKLPEIDLRWRKQSERAGSAQTIM